MAMAITRLSRVTGRSSTATTTAVDNSFEFTAIMDDDNDNSDDDHDDLPLMSIMSSGRSLGTSSSSSFGINRLRNSKQALEGKRKAASKSRRSLIMDSLEAVSTSTSNGNIMKPPSSTSLTVASTPSTTFTKSSANSSNNGSSVFKRASGFITKRSSGGPEPSETPSAPPPESQGWAQLVDEEEIDMDDHEDDMSLNDTPSRLNLKNNEVQTFDKWADTSMVSLLTTGDTTVTSYTIASSRTLGRPLPPKITQSQASLQSGFTRGTTSTLKPPSLKDLNVSSTSDEDDNTSLGTRRTSATLNILKPPNMKFLAPLAGPAATEPASTNDSSASIPQSNMMDPLKPPSLHNPLVASPPQNDGSLSHIEHNDDGDDDSENNNEDLENSAAVMTFMPYEQFDPTKLTSASTHKKNEAKKKREAAESKQDGSSSSPKVSKKKRPSGRTKTKRKKKSGAGKPKSSKRHSETSNVSEAAGEPSTITTTPTSVRRKLDTNAEAAGPTTPILHVRRKSGAKRASRLAAAKKESLPTPPPTEKDVTNPTNTIAADCESTVRSALTGDTSIISTPTTSVKHKLNTIADVESSIHAVRQRLDAHAADGGDNATISTPTLVRKKLSDNPNSPSVTRRRSNRMDRNALLVKRSSDGSNSGVRAVLAVSNPDEESSGSARVMRRTSSNSVRSSARATTTTTSTTITGNLNISNRSEGSGSSRRRASSHSRQSNHRTTSEVIDTSSRRSSTHSQNSGSARESTVRSRSVGRTAADNRRSIRRTGLSQSPGKHKNKLTTKDIMTSPGKRKSSGYISSFLGGSSNESVSGLSLGSIYKES